MKRAIAILAILVGVAHAGEYGPMLEVPAGWKVDDSQSDQVGKKLAAVSYFGLLPGDETVTAMYTPAKPGVVLSVVRVNVQTTEPAAAARAFVDELHAASQRAALAGSGIVEEGWQEKVDTAAKQVEATLAWRDTNAKTSSTARLIVFAYSETVTALTGECFASDDADPKLVGECKRALATLDIGSKPEHRQPIALAPTGTRPTPAAREPAGSGQTHASMSDGSRTPLPPMTIPQQPRATDRRPVYVGIGLVVLAAGFWWNRRRRARSEEESDER